MNELSRPAQGSDDNSQPWWVVFETHNVGEAHIVAGRLQSEGIPTQILTYAGGAALGITIGMFGEIRLLVPAQEAERARNILASDTLELRDDSSQVIFPPGDDAG